MLASAVLYAWTWQIWERVWVERPASFFPPELITDAKPSELHKKYPIYRSNDTYQWVAIADQYAQGNTGVLKHLPYEATPYGRLNNWHSGLARLLETINDRESLDVRLFPRRDRSWVRRGLISWRKDTGIRPLAKYLNRMGDSRRRNFHRHRAHWQFDVECSLIFSALFFFNASTQWDFAFSRLDHDAIFQLDDFTPK